MNTDEDELVYENMPDEPSEEEPPPAPQTAIQPVINTALIAPQVVNPDALPDLEAAEPGISLNPKYREFNDEGETVRAVFCGFTTMQSQNQEKQIPVAIFQTRTEVFVNAGANLVQQVKSLKPQTPVQITYTGKEKTKSGNYVKTFDVRLLVFGAKPGNGGAPKGGNPQTADKLRWLEFCRKNGVQEEHIRQALGTVHVSDWLRGNSKRTLEQAEKLVLEATRPF